MKHSILLLCIAVSISGVSPAGCRPAESATESADAAAKPVGPPNIVLITLCSFRMAHTGLGGYERDTMPFLSELAAQGIFFENAVSSSSWTKPSVASILTGLTPNVHGLTDMCGDREIIDGQMSPQRILADEIETLAERLRAAGYATMARVNNVQAGGFFNLTQGFDDASTRHELDTQEMLNELEDWLPGVEPERPFFFFMLTRDAHIPYQPAYEYYRRFAPPANRVPPDRYEGFCRWLGNEVKGRNRNKQRVPGKMRQSWIDLYDGELAQLDDALRRLPAILQAAGRRERTLIVIVADHGERFFEHRRVGHAGIPDECVVHVPLIFCGPGMPAGRRISAVVRSIDIYPTLTALADIDPPDIVQGQGLGPLIRGETDPAGNRTAFSTYKNMHHAVRDRDLKFHVWGDSHRRLYDLATDPGERMNLIEQRPEEAVRLEAELLEWLEQEKTLAEVVAKGGMRELTPEVIEQLRALGYLQ
jgi:arylsulfatase A-like enzyme